MRYWLPSKQAKATHASNRVTLLVADLHIRVITDDGQFLRELTLDTSRDTSHNTDSE